MRRDAWWVSPLLVFAGLSLFVAYSTWAAFQGRNYFWGPYLSPFYSPELFGDSPHRLFGPRPGWWPDWLIWSPALLILWAPGGFRLTCYYYRGAYYKAFWGDPPACTVGEPRNQYRGENSLPLILQNLHRYFLYISIIFLFFLWHDVWNAFWFLDPGAGQARFGIGLGTVVLAVNTSLLTVYALSCHSLRHLIGGRLNGLSRSPARFQAYQCASCLNHRHMMWAWLSLFSVGFADFYVRMCAAGYWIDPRII